MDSTGKMIEELESTFRTQYYVAESMAYCEPELDEKEIAFYKGVKQGLCALAKTVLRENFLQTGYSQTEARIRAVTEITRWCEEECAECRKKHGIEETPVITNEEAHDWLMEELKKEEEKHE